MILGSVPAVLIGSLLSSTVPDRFIRPVIAFAILASGLKYVGLSTTALGWALCGVLLAGAIAWLVVAKPYKRLGAQSAPAPATGEDEPSERPEPDTVSAG